MIKARTVPCTQCGAILTLGGPETVVLSCTYCGAEVLLDRPSPPPQAPPPPAPPREPPPVDHPIPWPKPAQPRSPVGCLITSFVLVSAFGGLSTLVPGLIEKVTSSQPPPPATFSITTSSTSTIVTTTTSTSSTSPTRRFWTAGGCLLDADGDDASDLFIVAVGPDGKSRPTVLSGRDGHVLWEGAPMPKLLPTVCVPAGGDRELVGVQRPDFTLELIDPKGSLPMVTVRLTDTLDGLSVGDGCFKAQSIDGQTATFSTATGGSAPCANAKPSPLAPLVTPSDWSNKRVLTLEKRTITVSKRPQGTPLITVAAADKTGYSLYSTALDLTALSFDFPVVRADENTIALVGNTHPEGRAVLMGVNATTGRVAYTTPVPHGTGPAVIPLSGSNGFTASLGRVYLLATGNVFVFDSATGALLWSMNP